MTEGRRLDLGGIRRVGGVAVLLVLPVLALQSFLLVYQDPGLVGGLAAFWGTTVGKVAAGVLALLLLAAAVDHARNVSCAPGLRRAAFHAAWPALAVLVAVHLASLAWFAERQPDAFAATFARLSNPFWRFLDLVTLALATALGTAGLAHRAAAVGRAPAAWTLAAGALLAAVFAFAYLALPLYPRNPVFGGP